MRTFRQYAAIALVYVGTLAFISCSQGRLVSQSVADDVFFTDTMAYPTAPGLVNYNYLYPSTDPFGRRVMLSATISMSPEVSERKETPGIILYNHYTVYRSQDCPSRGMLDLQTFLGGSRFIIVSADYYGFGITDREEQAYCIASTNAQASVDALIAARKLLAKAGYRCGDVLLNMGFSQGGQTSIGVLKLVTEKYPDIHFTRTMAAAGSYDIPETYRQFLLSGEAEMPSTVVGVLMAFNKYKGLKFPYNRIFKEPLASHVDEWVLSKRYNRPELDSLIDNRASVANDKPIAVSSPVNYVQPAFFDLQSPISKRFLDVLDSENLCKGWTPRADEDILLFHTAYDKTVPPANTANLYEFLKAKGVTNVELMNQDFGVPHSKCGPIFAGIVQQWMCTKLGVPKW